jgi:hypothetical protein
MLAGPLVRRSTRCAIEKSSGSGNGIPHPAPRRQQDHADPGSGPNPTAGMADFA